MWAEPWVWVWALSQSREWGVPHVMSFPAPHASPPSAFFALSVSVALIQWVTYSKGQIYSRWQLWFFLAQFSKQAQWMTLGGCGYLYPDDCFVKWSPCELCVDCTEICKTQRKMGFRIHLSPQNFLNTYLYNVFLIPVTLLNSLYTSSQQPGKACWAHHRKMRLRRKKRNWAISDWVQLLQDPNEWLSAVLVEDWEERAGKEKEDISSILYWKHEN